LEWRAQSRYATDLDFLFPSPRFKGSKPLSPDSILDRSIRPALARDGIVDKQIGWHSFRHSLATNLRSLGVDIKVAQELMRHCSCRTTLDIYTRAVDQQKREASFRVVELMLSQEMKKIPHPRRGRDMSGDAGKTSQNKRILWWTWSGSNPTKSLIIRKLLVLRIPRMPKMATMPDQLYVYCTVNLAKINSVPVAPLPPRYDCQRKCDLHPTLPQ
jgi:hypothetical protein